MIGLQNKSNKKFLKPVSYGLACVLLFIAWKLSFSQAVSAVLINRQLNAGQEGVSYSENTLSQLKTKNDFYLDVLKEYRVKKEDREGRQWSAISGLAMATDVGINFSPNKLAETVDSSEVVEGQNYQEFIFKGDYANLVKLVDTLCKTQGIGKIADMKLTSKKTDAEDKRLILKVGLVSVDR